MQLPGRTRVSFGNVMAEKVQSLLTAVLDKGQTPEKMVLGQFRHDANIKPWANVPYLDEHPFLATQRRVVLANSGMIDPGSIDEYIARGGYSALAKVLRHDDARGSLRPGRSSGLRGRGGGGFPTGKKWKFARATAGRRRST